MKRLLLFTASMALLASCSLTKHSKKSVGKLQCNFTIETRQRIFNKHIVIDSYQVWNTNDRARILMNYKPSIATCRGNGEVQVIDTFTHPYCYLLRVDGAVIKNDSELLAAKYVIVWEGKFFNTLKPYVNTKSKVYFETTAVLPQNSNFEFFNVVCGRIDKVEPEISNIIYAGYEVKKAGTK